MQSRTSSRSSSSRTQEELLENEHAFVVRNTFIESPKAQQRLHRSRSDSVLSQTSGSGSNRNNNSDSSVGLRDGQDFFRMGSRGKGGIGGSFTGSSGSGICSDRSQVLGVGTGAPAQELERPTAHPDVLVLFQELIDDGIVPVNKADILREKLWCVPRDPVTSVFTSIGSAGHPDTCRDCIFWFKGDCKKGVSCDFCHFEHNGQKKKHIRASKRTRQRIKNAMMAERDAEEAADEDPEDPGPAVDDVVPRRDIRL